MLLTDDELDRVAGGQGGEHYCTCDSPKFGPDGSQVYCSNCHGMRQYNKPGNFPGFFRPSNQSDPNIREDDMPSLDELNFRII